MQTISEGYKKAARSFFGQTPGLNAAQRALARWMLVDDYDALLDVGCASGSLLAHFAARHAIRACGLCRTTDEVRAIRGEMPEAEVISGALSDIPWQDQSFHSVALSGTPAFLGCADDFAREVRRVLRSDGTFYAAVPLLGQEESLFSFARRKELIGLFKRHGFTDVSLRISGLGYLALVAGNE